ncbi:sigma 54-interacting transcriptional regulator [Gluconacetobacter sacchari]|uniref:sigma 54-interacting transcriptional regulator n=1 Tax=Gluconacetobacter sacchari TaxID=92759 RepID=UPI0039B45AC3
MSDADGMDHFSAEFWRSQEMLLLRSVTTLVGRQSGTAAICREVVHLLSELLGLNRARILWRDTDGTAYRIRYAYGLTKEEIARGVYQEGEGITGTALRDKHLIIVQDIDREPLFLGRAVRRESLPPGKVAFIAMPILLPRNEVGLLACHRLRHRRRALADDVAILQILVTLVGQMLTLHNRVEEEKRALHEHNALLERALKASSRHGIIGNSPALLRVLTELEGVSASDSPLLLEGETSTGKELFARALHTASARGTSSFVRVNCVSVAEQSFEREFFGYERGAFVGARDRQIGYLEQASGGTLFLDDVNELPLSVQARLLHALERGTIARIGASRQVKIDVRVVSASSTPLKRQMEESRFRYDLFYRLNTISIRLPALRERPEDVPLLANHFLGQFNQKYQRNINLSASALSLLARHDWPGNVRQLSGAMEYVVLMAREPMIAARDLHALLRSKLFDTTAASIAPAPVLRPYLPASSHSREELIALLRHNGGNRSNAARQLGITTRQLSYRLKLLNISARDIL